MRHWNPNRIVAGYIDASTGKPGLGAAVGAVAGYGISHVAESVDPELAVSQPVAAAVGAVALAFAFHKLVDTDAK